MAELLVSVEGQRYALPLERVRRAVCAVEVTPYPAASDSFLGVIDVGGDVLPVVHLRRRLGLCSRPPDVGDCMVIAWTSEASLVLPVDAVLGITGELEAAADVEITPAGAECASRVLSDADGLVFMLDVERIVGHEELTSLHGALAEAQCR
jgi:purine-binding chemotaxis protein CheW